MTGTGTPDTHPADRQLFADNLDCELVLPVAVAPSGARGRSAQAVSLLQGLAQIEDLRKDDGGSEEHGDLPLLAQRMDAKLDLILALVGRLAMRADALPEHPVRWARTGVRVDLHDATGLTPRARALVRLQPADWLPDHLEQAATVLASESFDHGARAWLAFADVAPDLDEALDRHLLRLHRRQVAEQRRR